MDITTAQVKEIRQELAKLKPVKVTVDGTRRLTVKEAVFALARTLERMKKRGFDAQEIAEKLHEKGIDVKPPTLAKYLNEFRRGKDRKTDTPRPPEKSSEFGVHQTQIHKWVKQVKESAAGIFVGEIKTEEVKKELTRLHAKIGQLTVERDFLAEAWGKRRASPPGKAWSRRIVRSSALCVSAIYSREPAPACTMKKRANRRTTSP